MQDYLNDVKTVSFVRTLMNLGNFVIEGWLVVRTTLLAQILVILSICFIYRESMRLDGSYVLKIYILRSP